MPETRSSKKPLTEDEIRILQDQLILKQQQLAEQEKSIFERERDTENKYKQLQKRENEYINREKQQAERFSAQQAPMDEAASLPPPRPEDSAIMSTLQALIQELNSYKTELADIRDIQRQQSGRSLRTPPVTSPRAPRAHTMHESVAPRLTYKEALESVPTFDGESTPVLKFARACNRLKELFPFECEPTLTQLLRNKLRGRAYTAVEDNFFSTIDDFVDQLKTIFGASKSVNQYRGELGNIAKREGEHAIDYISRVKDLHCAILEGETKNLGPLTQDRKRYFENETLLCFLAGLPPDFRLRLKLEGYTDLPSAYETAIRVEKEIARDTTHFANQQNSKPSSPSAQVKISTTDKPSCGHCGKPGHAIEKCWLKNPELRPERSNKKRETTKGTVCDYCSKTGHTREQCFKRKNDENKNSGNGDSRPPNSGAGRSEKMNEHPVRTTLAQDQTDPQSSSESSDMPTFD